jgi:hypothetical protein
MKNKGKILILLTSLIVLLIVWKSVCSVPRVKGKVVDENNNGIAGAFVIYGYEGSVYKVVDSDSYYRLGTIVRTNEKGFFEIPRTTHFHAPFLKTDLFLDIYVVYDANTHCAGLLPYNRWHRSSGLDVFKEEKWWLTYKREGDLETLIFQDVTSNPIAWYNSIRQLHVPLEKYGWNSWDAPTEDKHSFLKHLLREYEEFQKQYGQEECLYRDNFTKSQFPVSYEDFKEMKWHGKTYEEYKEANESFYKGKTWNEVVSHDKRLLDNYTKRLFGKPDLWHSR